MEKLQFGSIAMLVQWFWQQQSYCHAHQNENIIMGQWWQQLLLQTGSCDNNLEQTSDKGKCGNNQLTAISSW